MLMLAPQRLTETDNFITQSINGSKKYHGVCWDKSKERYYALITYYDIFEKKALTKRRGFYDDPKQAAIAVDELCDLVGLERKNFDVDGDAVKTTSIYNGVVKCKRSGKWLTYVNLGKS